MLTRAKRGNSRASLLAIAEAECRTPAELQHSILNTDRWAKGGRQSCWTDGRSRILSMCISDCRILRPSALEAPETSAMFRLAPAQPGPVARPRALDVSDPDFEILPQISDVSLAVETCAVGLGADLRRDGAPGPVCY